MSRCPDCPDLPNGTRKRDICCKREGGKLKVGDVVPFVRPPLDVRPAFTGAGSTSFKPARHGKRKPMKTAEFGQPAVRVPQPGKCRICGSTSCDDGGPVGPTEWADETRTLCDEPDCIAAAKREIGR